MNKLILYSVILVLANSSAAQTTVDTIDPQTTISPVSPSPETTLNPTTQTVTSAPIASTTPSYLQATTWCRTSGSVGRFPPNSNQQQVNSSGYIYCYFYNGAMFGQYYECPGRTVFNAKTQLCGLA